jgi:hypothetical protein
MREEASLLHVIVTINAPQNSGDQGLKKPKIFGRCKLQKLHGIL